MTTVKSYFDNQGHQHAYHNDPEIYNFIIQFLRNKSLNNKKINVLDFGCGDGSFIKSLTNMKINAIYYGTDISETMIRMGRSNIQNNEVNLVVSDGFNMPFSDSLKFDIIHLDSVIHHLIGKSVSDSKKLVANILNILFNRLANDGSLIVEEPYYNSYLYSPITSILIFYGLKFFNYLKIDINKVIKEYHRGLEVRFLPDQEIIEILRQYGKPTLIKKIPWKIPNSYRFFLLKNFGHVTYLTTKTNDKKSE